MIVMLPSDTIYRFSPNFSAFSSKTHRAKHRTRGNQLALEWMTKGTFRSVSRRVFNAWTPKRDFDLESKSTREFWEVFLPNFDDI